MASASSTIPYRFPETGAGSSTSVAAQENPSSASGAMRSVDVIEAEMVEPGTELRNFYLQYETEGRRGMHAPSMAEMPDSRLRVRPSRHHPSAAVIFRDQKTGRECSLTLDYNQVVQADIENKANSYQGLAEERNKALRTALVRKRENPSPSADGTHKRRKKTTTTKLSNLANETLHTVLDYLLNRKRNCVDSLTLVSHRFLFLQSRTQGKNKATVLQERALKIGLQPGSSRMTTEEFKESCFVEFQAIATLLKDQKTPVDGADAIGVVEALISALKLLSPGRTVEAAEILVEIVRGIRRSDSKAAGVRLLAPAVASITQAPWTMNQLYETYSAYHSSAGILFDKLIEVASPLYEEGSLRALSAKQIREQDDARALAALSLIRQLDSFGSAEENGARFVRLMKMVGSIMDEALKAHCAIALIRKFHSIDAGDDDAFEEQSRAAMSAFGSAIEVIKSFGNDTLKAQCVCELAPCTVDLVAGQPGQHPGSYDYSAVREGLDELIAITEGLREAAASATASLALILQLDMLFNQEFGYVGRFARIADIFVRLDGDDLKLQGVDALANRIADAVNDVFEESGTGPASVFKKVLEVIRSAAGDAAKAQGIEKLAPSVVDLAVEAPLNESDEESDQESDYGGNPAVAEGLDSLISTAEDLHEDQAVKVAGLALIRELGTADDGRLGTERFVRVARKFVSVDDDAIKEQAATALSAKINGIAFDGEDVVEITDEEISAFNTLRASVSEIIASIRDDALRAEAARSLPAALA
jgi:hypothetical protein